MKETKEVDPELHALRMLARADNSREGSALETPRFNLYQAIENQDRDAAARWLIAVRIGVHGLSLEGQMAADAAAVVEALTAALEE